ncbi:MAG: hypothetical protein WD638_02185 [Nitriliruptoraceae bacterium]
MVPFDVLAALVAGLLGAIAMTLMMQAASAMGMTKMPAMALIQGTMVTGDESKAKQIGFVTHVIMMGTVVFGLLYAALFVALDDAGALTGILIGLAHGIVAGIAMAMMGRMHPRMDPPPVAGNGEVVTTVSGEVRVVEPGLFAKNYGPMTPMGLLVGHVIYGLVVALVYGALA